MLKFKFTDKAIKIMKEAEELFIASAGASKTIDFTPKRATEGSSGYDLKACLHQPLTIWQDEVIKIPTGCHIWIGELEKTTNIDEEGDSYGTFHYWQTINDFKFAGLYLPRSSNPGLKLENTVGLLDSDYQEESFLKYRNISNFPITLAPGEKIGQLVIVPTYIGDMELVEDFKETTTRVGGFGSTGKY